MVEYTQDAFGYVRNYERLDIFITYITIGNESMSGQKDTDLDGKNNMRIS